MKNKVVSLFLGILNIAAILTVAALLAKTQPQIVQADSPNAPWCHCEPNGSCQTLNLPLSALENAGHVNASGQPLHAGDHAGECTTDLCSNVDGIQESVPEGYYESEGECFAKTPVCTDDSATNFDNNVDETEIADNSVCTYEGDACPNIEGNQEEVPEGYHLDEQDQCIPDERVTPTPTPPPGNPGGPGDGLSDGRSDGRSSCPECTKAPQGQVLGATTEFAATGVAADAIMNIVGLVGGISTAAGVLMVNKKKSN